MASKCWISGLLIAALVAYASSASIGGCQDVLDVVAVVDGSDSISEINFKYLKAALVDLTNRLRIDSAYTRFGVVLYSTTVTSVINFSGDRASLQYQINSLVQPRDGTNTHMGISSMIDMVRNTGRFGVDTIGIVITDGISKQQEQTKFQATLAKNIGVNMYSVGIGLEPERDMNELRDIATTPAQAIDINDYRSLGATLKGLLPDICPTTTTTTTTTTTQRPTTTTQRPTSTTTRTTTTRRFTIPQVTPRANNTSAGLCEGCVMPNGIGYLPHPTYCHKYIQCNEVKDGAVEAIVRKCGTGLFWDQQYLTCNYPDQVVCANDPCSVAGTVYYRYDDNCRQYYTCGDITAHPMCCATGQSFNQGTQRCQFDSSCVDLCLGEADATVFQCNKRLVAGKPGVYEENVPGFGWMQRPCAYGTGYNTPACSCTILRDTGADATTMSPVNTGCQAELKLTFDNGVMDTSGKSNWVGNQGVVINNGEAYFDGASGLRIPRFSNVALGSTFRIKMRYRTDGAVMGQQALVSNRDCGKAGSLSIILDQSSTTFGMSTALGQRTSVPVSAQPQDQWKVIEYKVDNGQLTANVDGKTNQQATNGDIATSECALQIGRGNTFSNFKGYVDYIEVYMC